MYYRGLRLNELRISLGPQSDGDHLIYCICPVSQEIVGILNQNRATVGTQVVAVLVFRRSAWLGLAITHHHQSR